MYAPIAMSLPRCRGARRPPRAVPGPPRRRSTTSLCACGAGAARPLNACNRLSRRLRPFSPSSPNCSSHPPAAPTPLAVKWRDLGGLGRGWRPLRFGQGRGGAARTGWMAAATRVGWGRPSHRTRNGPAWKSGAAGRACVLSANDCLVGRARTGIMRAQGAGRGLSYPRHWRWRCEGAEGRGGRGPDRQ